MAQKCLSGCVKGVKGLPELLRPRLGGRAEASAQDRQPTDVLQDGMAASIPQLSCPGLISRSQSALSEDGAASFTPQRPTLLTASKAVSPSHGEKNLSPQCGAEAENEGGSLSALTTATAFEEAGSPGNAQAFGCCIAGMPRSDSPEWFWDTSMAIGSAAWTGGRHVASFLGEQIYEAAVMAQPHVQSMATSAANALKVAAEDSVDKLRALGPRTSKMSKLDRARASMALQPPVLQTPALPSLPELDAYTAQMAFYPPYSAQPHMQGHALGGAAWNYPPRCSSFSAQGYGYAPNSQAYAGYSYQSYPAYQVYQSYQCYDPQPQQLQPSYSFDVSQAQPRYSLGRRVPLAQNRIISATKVEQ